jgi:hypothetical protein
MHGTMIVLRATVLCPAFTTMIEVVYIAIVRPRLARQLALLSEIRDAQRHVVERLDEVNLRLRIQRDPFHAMTIEGRRQDEGARENVRAAELRPSRLPLVRGTPEGYRKPSRTAFTS